MTIVFQMGDEFWIENIIFPSEDVAAAADYDHTVALEKPGDFLAGALMNLQDEFSQGRGYILLGVPGGILTLGANVTSIRVFAVNNHSTNNMMRSGAVIFMRKSSS